jgi:uncharacterized protein (DUF1015 family)
MITVAIDGTPVTLTFRRQNMQIRPFKSWCARPDLAAQVAAVPYDVVNTAEAAGLAAGIPYSFLHVSRAEIDMAPGIDPYSESVYQQGRDTLIRFQKEGIVIQEATPQLFLYRQTMGRHVQRGIVACCSTAEYEQKIIKIHEKTRQDKEDDRTRHIKTLNAQTGPVFLLYRDNPALNTLVAEAEKAAPLFDFIAADGVAHAGWKFANPESVSTAFSRVPVAYIADGHHRAASAARVARERRATHPDQTGEESYNWFLGVLFPASQMKILAYNRLIKDLNGLTPAAFLEMVHSRFTVTPATSPAPAAPGSICMLLGNIWYELRWSLPANTSLESQLDVSVLQERLLAPVLGIDDPRTSKRIEFVGGIRGTSELETRISGGDYAVAFSMHPTTVEQLMDIADTGGIMPPKSTWFEPKLRDGLFVHVLAHCTR